MLKYYRYYMCIYEKFVYTKKIKQLLYMLKIILKDNIIYLR